MAGIPGTVTGFLTYLFIPWFEKRLSSKQIVIGCSLANAALATIVFLIGAKFYTNPAVIVPLLAVQGIFTSIISSLKMVVPTKMIGDTVDYMEWKSGERNEGITFSLLTFISKITGSFSTGIATAIMPIIGLQNINDELVLMDSGVNTRFWLWALITAIPAILGLIALIPYKFYDLDGEKLETIHREIKIHRENRTKAATARHGSEE